LETVPVLKYFAVQRSRIPEAGMISQGKFSPGSWL
jgi:hypothetical protein